jgi:hypothetical protein
MTTFRARWSEPAPDQPPWCLGAVELAPLAGIALRLHFELPDADDGPTVGIWRDESGRLWDLVEAEQA